MSLNGLDTANVNDAYQAALTEAGGWFLLKYIARDAVDLLNAGSGGVTEVRETIEQYDEKSPLYGFVQYRRRKVLLKFVPEGTSRLLQARVSVQFQSVLERFAPHDAVISIAHPTELKEAALSSACSLHTASTSIRSSDGSQRGGGLAEIAEVAGEQQDTIIAKEPQRGGDDHHPYGKGSSMQTSAANGNHEPKLPNKVQPQGHGVLRTITPPEDLNTDKALPATPTPTNLDTTRSKANELMYDARPSVDRPGANRLCVDRPGMDRASLDIPSMDRATIDRLNTDRASSDKGQTSRSSRSSTVDVYDVYKPKVKLGPRPSVDSSGRQHTPGSQSRLTEPRLVSSLPSGVRMPPRKPLSAKSQPQQISISVQRRELPKISLPPSPIQVTSAYPIDRPYPNPGNANGYFRHANTSASKTQTLTPEKQRLMKALQLRKEQMAKQKGSEKLQMQPTLPSSASDTTHTRSNDAQDSRFISRDVVAIEPSQNTTSPAMGESVPSSVNAREASPPHSSEGPPTPGASIMQEREIGVEVDTPKQTETPSHSRDLPVESVEHPISSSVQPLTRVENIDNLVNHQHSPTTTTTDSDPFHNSLPQEVPLSSVTELEESSLPPQRVVLQELQELRHISPDHDSDTLHAEPNSDATVKAQLERDTANAGPATAEITDLHSVERPAWRRGLADPIRIVSSADDSDDLNFLSDDSFMEELKSATVQEAKPISVSKSPITPLFPRRLSDQQTNGVSVVSRTVLSPIGDANAQNQQHLSPELPIHGSMRSVSASPSSDIRPQQASAPMAKKVNVSSGISQRIKALEMFTSRENSPVGQSHSPATSPVGSVRSVRNTSLTTSPQKSDSVKNNGLAKPVDARRISPSASPEAVIPDHKRRLNGTPVTADDGRPRPESISVTATIIRDARNEGLQIPVDCSGLAATELLQSPLVVEHQAKEWVQDRSHGRTSKYDRPSSIHSSNLESSRDSITSGRSISGRKDGRPGAPRSMSDGSSNGLASPDEQQEEKRGSRTSRLFKRMSSSFSAASRRSIVQALSPTVKGEPIFEHHERVPRVLPNIVDVGDVNVQFPDTLLWKRRYMRLDDRGNLILSPSRADDNIRSVIKQYHISDFRTPYVPDQDQQELPYSVILDFNDGSTLQCACEHPAGQALVLNCLKDAHRAYSPLYGS
ncbi:ADF-H/Gelsolin-like domain [Lasallia pustulata]|uniref:ADF-H/Gelsolin-like domain n=1 Tax=Lasallia pustulata TaxID=136370 RepID=A0A1W5D0S1_9LECA|nr:ADF-H/Gelsolin-like domain [Lasallia pustulata]